MQRKVNCRMCCQSLGVKDQPPRRSPIFSTRVPLLLRCGHSYCEECLGRIVKQEKTAISCPECKASTPLEQEGSLNSLIPDIYLLGEATLAKARHPSNQVGINFYERKAEHKSQERKNNKKELCSECSVRQASCRCAKCDVLMCTPCFETVHKGSKTLKKHDAIPLYEDASLASVAAVCAKHDDRLIEYYCGDDDEAICSHCVIVGQHQGHHIIPLERKNDEAVANLDGALKNASSILNKFRRSEKTMITKLPSIRQKMLEIHHETREQFRHLHALLQRREWEILTELDNAFQLETSPLDQLRTSLREESNRVRACIKDAELAMSNKQHIVVNAQEVLSRLRKLEDVPCDLTLKLNEAATSFTFDEKVAETLGSLGKLEMERCVTASFLTWKESPEETEIDDEDNESILTVDSDSTRASFSRSTSLLDDPSDQEMDHQVALMAGLTVSDTSSPTTKNKKRAYRQPRISKSDQLMVHVTHIKHPCNFMVQQAELDGLNRLAHKIQVHCQSTKALNDVPNDLTEDMAVLAQFTGDNKWYRAVITCLVFHHPDPNQAKVDVFYVDFGNSETIPVSRLRSVYPRFMQFPAQALPASLIEIAPADPSGEWTLEAVKSFASMTGDKPLYMQIIDEVDGVYMVDLCKPVSDDGVDTRPVSVRDALVFLEVAILLPDLEPRIPSERPKPQRRYVTPAPLIPGEKFNCSVSHVDTPNCFFIQKLGQDGTFLQDLMTKLQTVYGNDTRDLWNIFYPQLNLICVALYEEDNQWYRAQVVNVPGRCFVDVLYVDFGNVARVHYTKLRAVQPSFLTLPMSAICCTLADVVSVDDDSSWPTEAIAKFTSFIFTTLKVEVVCIGEDYIPQIILYTMDDLCINSQLVIEGMARSTGKASQIQYRPKSPLELQMEEESKMLLVEEDRAPVKAPVKTKKARPREEIDKNAPDYMTAFVTHIENPGHLYIQLSSASRDGLDSLMLSLKEQYSGSEPVKGCLWEENDDCAALLKSNDKWYRTKILKPPDKEGRVNVRTIDFGFPEVVPVCCLRTLTEEHHTMPAFALRAHLSGIQPAGDPNRWSRTSTDHAREILKGISVYFVPNGDVDKGSFPCDLLVTKVSPGDALNPEIIEYKSVTEMLLDRGVALPNRRLSRQSSTTQVTVAPKIEEPHPKTKLEDKSEPPKDRDVVTDNRKDNRTDNRKDAADTVIQGEKPADKNSTAQKDDPSMTELGKKEGTGNRIKEETGVKFTNILDTKSVKEDEPSEKPRKPDAAGDAPEIIRRTTSVTLDTDTMDMPKVFAPPALPTERHLRVVPTYVDWNLRILFHIIKDDEDVEGRFGFCLKEHTLETIVQDGYLSRWGLYRAHIPRDGNCLFRALAQSIYNDQCYQQKVRYMAVNHISANWESVRERVAVINKEVYLREMIQDGMYGGEPEIMAIASWCDTSVELILGGLDYPVTVRRYGSGHGLIRLIYISDGNYDSGHYDLAVESLEEVNMINTIYYTWRDTKIREMRQWPIYKDDHFYDDSLLQQLSDYIKDKYEKSTPESEEVKWCVGQSVVALYPVDNLFYRARIEDITDKGIKVFYVDFGNSHVVQHSQLRQKICLEDVPCQCYSSVLHDTKPNSQLWAKSTFDWLHTRLVDTSCMLEVMVEPKAGEDLVVKVTLTDGKDLATLLKDSGLALPLDAPLTRKVTSYLEVDELGYLPPDSSTEEEDEDEANDVVEEEEKEEKGGDNVNKEEEVGVEEEEEEEEEAKLFIFPERTAPSPYVPMTTLKVGEMIPMQITHVNYPNKVYVQHIMNKEASDPRTKKRNSELKGLLKLSEEMRADVEKYPCMTFVKPGMACCVQYQVDEQWYRGEILTVEPQGDITQTGVLFVDYGTFEYKDSSRLRALPQKMLLLPSQAILAEVGGLLPPSGLDTWPVEALSFMDKLLVFNTTNVIIKALQPDLVVDLLPDTATSLEDSDPIYQPLIEMGLARSLPISSDGLVWDEPVLGDTASMAPNIEIQESASHLLPETQDKKMASEMKAKEEKEVATVAETYPENLESPEFLAECQVYAAAQLPLTVEERRAIEKATRGQATNPEWFRHRVGRITASVVGQIVRRRLQTPPDALLRKIFKYDPPGPSPPACRHGSALEDEARDEYIKHCHRKGLDVVVEEKGIIIDEIRPWYGASVDGVVQVTAPIKDTGLIEIKCPYVSDQSLSVPKSVQELASKRKSFYIDSAGKVNRNHNYYYQMQAQMAITRTTWCDFVLYYKVEREGVCDISVTRVPFDGEAYKEVLCKVDQFYLEAVVPELKTRRVERGERLYPNSQRYRYNEQRENKIGKTR